MAFLQVLEWPSDDMALERIINVPARGVGKKTVEDLKAYAQVHRVPLWDAVERVAAEVTDTVVGRSLPPVELSARASSAVAAFYATMTDLSQKAKDAAPQFQAALDEATQTEQLLVAARAAAEESQLVAGTIDGLTKDALAAKDAVGAGPGSVPWLIVQVLRDTGYEGWLRYEQPDGEARWQNLRDLVNLAAGFPADQLVEFLDKVALISDQDVLNQPGTVPSDGNHQPSSDVKLMTIHASKGLEFDVVFLVGCEEDLLPHYHSTVNEDALSPVDNEQIDEERRLMYVGMTRARQQLFMCCARTRLLWGMKKRADRSRFLDDIPCGLVERVTGKVVQVDEDPSKDLHFRQDASLV